MAIAIPALILKQLYTFGSLQNEGEKLNFALKNRLSDAMVTGISHVAVDGIAVALDELELTVDGQELLAAEVSAENAFPFALRSVIDVGIPNMPLGKGEHTIDIFVETTPFGTLEIRAEDIISTEQDIIRIPRNEVNDLDPATINKRKEFVETFSDTKLDHVGQYSVDPSTLAGNIEHFTGVAQIPMGFAGPLRVNGEHAEGDFVIPLATTEGTLVASYNRGIKVINLSGGVKTTVVDDAMQRAPVFVFDDARGARDFIVWLESKMPQIKAEAEATSSIAKLLYIDPYLSNKFAFLRFNFTTGDGAGQNMVSKATFAACSWIYENYDLDATIRHFYLESNFATDKKHSQVNMMKTRGKRVTAEATIPREVMIQHTRVTPEALVYHSGIANVGGFLSGISNNGLHSANAITAMFIACGQDVANVAESSTALIYCEVTDERDLYVSVTIPSLIVATYGGGTGLATQRECLSVLDCYGPGKVRKFAEIVAGVVLAGEISLAAAISSSDWVSSHEEFGRNR